MFLSVLGLLSALPVPKTSKIRFWVPLLRFSNIILRMEKGLSKKRNPRDLSYLKRKDGLGLKEGLFFRSGALWKLSKKERSFLLSHVSTVIDLRTAVEIGKKPDDPLPGVKHYEIPILKAETMGITHGKGIKGYVAPPDMLKLYPSLVTDPESVEGIKKVMDVIFDPDREGPILWHCTAGKDRCGLITALFLFALGYEEKDIVADYCLSDKPSAKRGRHYRRLIRCLFRWKLAHAVYLTMRAVPEYLESAFEAIRKKYGSIDAFIKDTLGLTKKRIDLFLSKNLAN